MVVNLLEKFGIGKPIERRVWIHIGWHKTGSTSLQQALYRFRNELEERFSIRYLETGQGQPAPPTHQTVPNHQPLGMQLLKGNDELLTSLVDEVSKSAAKDLVLSFEGFRHLDDQQIAILVNALRDCGRKVNVVAYVRETVALMVSLYRQRMRRMMHLDGAEGYLSWFRSTSHGMLGYSSTLELWSNAVGTQELYVRDYDGVVANGGDTVADFFDLVGGQTLSDWVKTREKSEGVEPANPSLRNRFIEPMRKVGRHWAGDRDELSGNEMNEFLCKVAIPLVESDPPKHRADLPLFSDDQLAKIAVEQEADFKVVEDRWMNGERKLRRFSQSVKGAPVRSDEDTGDDVWADFCMRVAGLKVGD